MNPWFSQRSLAIRKIFLISFLDFPTDDNLVDFGQHSLFALIFLSTIYALLSLSALAGNSIVIWIISKEK